MGRPHRFVVVMCVSFLVLLSLQATQVRADLPNTGANEYNHASAASGATATASGSTGSNVPGNAIDSSASTWWESSSTTGFLAIRFARLGTVDEVHVHFAGTTVYPKLSVYTDGDGDQTYEFRAWTTTGNTQLNVKASLPSVNTYGIKITIDGKVGSTRPKIADVGAYLRYDSDGDGLTNAQESSTIFFQDAGSGGLPMQIPDDEENSTAVSVSLARFHGVGVRALANFTVDHTRTTDLSAAVGYWNGTAWVDRWVWDPGKRLLSIGITNPVPTRPAEGDVPVVATVAAPDITTKVEFRVDGVLRETVTSPVGNEYQWTWPTSGDAPHTLNVTQYDEVGARAWDQETIQVNNLGPSVTWLSPANGATVSGLVSVRVAATDYYGIQSVTFYLDNVLQFTDTTPDAGTNDFVWEWDSSGTTLGPHVLKAIASDGLAPYAKTTTATISVTSENDPTVSITAPQPESILSETVTVQATASSGSSTISRVEFLVDGFLRASDTTAPFAWAWDTRPDPNGIHTLAAKAYRTSDGKVATASITVYVQNECTQACPAGPAPGAFEAEAAPASMTLGILGSDWTPGEVSSGSVQTIVVDLGTSQESATAAENSSRIFRPGLPLAHFIAYLPWRLLVRDWYAPLVTVCGPDPPGPIGPDCWQEQENDPGNVTAFTLRFEATSDPFSRDTDGDGLSDAVERITWGTLPVTRDSDLDGLTEDYEIAPHTLTVQTNGASSVLAAFTTNPAMTDSDLDGLSDGQERGVVTTGRTKAIGEVGTVTGLGAEWRTIFLRNRYSAPVVLAEPASFRDRAFGHVRIGAVTDHTVQLRMERWLPDGSGLEDVTYLVVESGSHILPDGTVVEAGTKASVGTLPATVAFREPFTSVPLVLVQSQSTADLAPVVAKRTGAIGLSSVGVYLNANGSTSHGAETVGYVAIAPPADPAVLSTWTRAAVGLGHPRGPWTFPSNFSSAPLIVAWMGAEEANGGKNIGIRLESVSNGIATFYREEASGAPATDTVEAFAFAGPMNLTARMTTRPTGAGSTDTDGDGLSDGVEVLEHGSDPTRTDTDADGIPDGVETTGRDITLPVNGALRTFTIRTSPISDDTDADGVKDPDELAGIWDYKVLSYDMSTTTGTVRDLSGNGHPGTLVGTSTSTAGKLGNARDFDGGNSYLEAGDLADFEGTAAFTVGAWFRRDASHAYWPRILSKETVADASGNRHGWLLYVHKVDAADGSTLDNKIGFDRWSGNTFGAAHYSGVTSTTVTAMGAWTHVAVTYDGATLRMYVNGVLEDAKPATNLLAGNAKPLRVGALSDGGWSGFNGAIDEVQVWDRALDAAGIRGYVTLVNGGGFVGWYDMETRAGADLLDLFGSANPGVTAGTTVVEGRAGFGRRFASATDGVVVGGSPSIPTAVTLDAYVLLASFPDQDTAILARKGSFYLNVTSDGRLQWSLHNVGTIASPLSLPLNRWIRVSATGAKVTTSTSTLALYVDGTQVATAGGGKFPASSNPVTIGYMDGGPHLAASIDEVRILSVAATPGGIADTGIRGILLNPNATDTDGDGLADGQELFVKTVKTPKRYPTGLFATVLTDAITPAVAAPAWAILRADAMVGFTHPEMGELSASLLSAGASPNVDILLRAGSNVGEANNFTSVDLLQKPALGGAWLAAEDFVKPGRSWRLSAYDGLSGNFGQIEYLQIQLTLRTLPNSADTDADGLNDSEELNLGSDGFQTDPWMVDTDGDTIGDALEYAGWSRSGSTVVANPNGFHTDPTRADTDYDGYADNVDRWPLVDAYVEVYVDYYQLITQSVETSTLRAYPYVIVTDAAGDKTVSAAYIGAPCTSIGSGWYSCSGRIDHQYTLDVPDTASFVTVTFEFRQDRSRYNAGGDIGASITLSGSNVATDTWTIDDGLFTTNTFRKYESQTLTTFNGVDQKNRIEVYVRAKGGSRSTLNLVVPLDYGDTYNVTDSAGSIVGRRYVGEPRFVEVLINGSAPTAYFIPRSLFFDTKFHKDLQSQIVLQAPPYTKMKGYQNGTTSANSDLIQMAFVFDGLTAAEALAVRDALLKNATGVVNKTLLTWSAADWSTRNSPYLASLPVELIQAVPLLSWTSSPSHPENIDSNQPPVPFWVQLAQGIASAIAQTLQWVQSGLVWLANAAVQFVEMLKNFGSWVGDLTSGDPVRVRNAVQAAQQALDGFVSWIIDGAISLFRSGLAYVDIRLIANSIIPPVIPIDGSGLAAGAIEAFLNAVFSGWFFYTLVGVGLLLQLVATYLTIQSFGAALVASHVILPKLIEILVQTWLRAAIAIGVSLAITASIAAMLYLVLPNADPFWREGLGLSFISIALAVEKSPQIINGFRADPTGVARELFGFAIAFIGLIVAFSLSDVTGAFWGFVLAAAGAAITLLNRDAFDISPVSPLKNIEEITSVVSLAYASANLAKEITT